VGVQDPGPRPNLSVTDLRFNMGQTTLDGKENRLGFKDLARMKGYATVFACVQPLIQTREKAAPSEPRIETIIDTRKRVCTVDPLHVEEEGASLKWPQPRK